jgi:hypothetical protein
MIIYECPLDTGIPVLLLSLTGWFKSMIFLANLTPLRAGR